MELNDVFKKHSDFYMCAHHSVLAQKTDNTIMLVFVYVFRESESTLVKKTKYPDYKYLFYCFENGKFVYSSVFEYVETIYTYSHKSIYTIVENNCPFSFKNFKTHTYLQPKKFGLAVFRHRINIQDIMEYSLFPEEVFLISSFDCSAHDLDTIWKTTNN